MKFFWKRSDLLYDIQQHVTMVKEIYKNICKWRWKKINLPDASVVEERERQSWVVEEREKYKEEEKRYEERKGKKVYYDFLCKEAAEMWLVLVVQ
jgi:Fe-S cluster biosynthesis and repair protein YggX